MNNAPLISSTVEYVKTQLRDAEGGHDWWHIQRVWNNAQHIVQYEPGDPLVVSLGALLHDIADSKFHGGDESIGPHLTAEFLASQQVAPSIIDQVVHIVTHISFKGGFSSTKNITPELAIARDADRLDAIGAIGIARAFNYGGFKHRALYDPNIPPQAYLDKESYKKSTAPTINHFYEKLLKLKDMMHTPTGKKLAEERHAFMEQYLSQFYREWTGKA